MQAVLIEVSQSVAITDIMAPKCSPHSHTTQISGLGDRTRSDTSALSVFEGANHGPQWHDPKRSNQGLDRLISNAVKKS